LTQKASKGFYSFFIKPSASVFYLTGPYGPPEALMVRPFVEVIFGYSSNPI